LDHLGSTSLLVDTNGSVVERSEYFPYGAIESGGSEKYGFTGQENDADTGLMYYGARYYSPGYRVFVQPDTMLPDPYDPQALNRYSYCLNNPLRYTDPSGHIIDVALDLGFIGMDVVDIYNDPSDTWAWVALGADVVCAVIPVATDGGLGVKALKKGVQETDNIGDLFKLLDNTADTGKVVGNSIDNQFDDVARYIQENGKLPDNYLTKDEAKQLGWVNKNGNLADVAPGKMIGGDVYANTDRLLPHVEGRVWHEADIGYEEGFRNSYRVVYSNDGLIYRTDDHYKTFEKIELED
jgi:RHS repeat-associated protein